MRRNPTRIVPALALLALLALLAPAAEAQERAADRLLAVELERAPEATTVRLVANGELAYETLRLGSPERFVVDLAGVVQGVRPTRLAVAEPALERVRLGQFRGAPAPVTRVVFDLGPGAPTASPRIERAADGLRVVFGEEETRGATAPTSRAAPAAPAPPGPTKAEAVPALPDPPEEGPTGAAAPVDLVLAAPEPEGLARRPARLVVSGQLDELSSGDGGGGGRLDWIRPGAGGRTFFAGLASYRLADSRWSYARAGAAGRRGRVGLSGEVQRGRGERGPAGALTFDHALYQATLSLALVPRHLYLELEDRYLDIDESRGNLAKAALTVSPGPRLTGALGYSRSTGGNFDAEFVQGRVDLRAGRLRLLAGFADGHTRPEALGLVGAGGGGEFDQLFAGVGFPLGSAELTLVADRIEFDNIDRETLTLSLSTPLPSVKPP